MLKLYLIISGGIFFLVGIIHLFRLIYQFNIIFGTIVIPQELSYAGFPVAIFYSIWACWLLVQQMKKKMLIKLKG